jgi:hypothetical protein
MSADNKILQDQLQAKVEKGWENNYFSCPTYQSDVFFVQIGIGKCRTTRSSCAIEAREQ